MWKLVMARSREKYWLALFQFQLQKMQFQQIKVKNILAPYKKMNHTSIH